MDKDLAVAVLTEFSSGAKINDTMLEKAAQCIGVDSREVIKEARLKTYITNYLEKGASSDLFQDYLSAACGISRYRLEKIAKMYAIPLEKVAITYLQAQNFTMDEKLAEFDTGVANGQNLQQDPAALQQPQLPPSALTSQDPFGNTMFQPSPSAPAQVPPTDEGNMGQLMENDENKEQIQSEQETLGANQMLAEQGQQQQQMPKEQIEQALMAADAEGKAKYIAPNATPDQLSRLTQNIQAVEQQAGLPIKDPGQLKKVLQMLEKQDNKKIDEAIKLVGESISGSPETGNATGPLPPPADNIQDMNISQDLQKLARKIRKIK